MRSVNMHQAKTQLSRLVELAARGEEILIARNGLPVAKLGPLDGGRTWRVPGSMRGQLEVRDDFDAPLPEDLARLFEGDEQG